MNDRSEVTYGVESVREVWELRRPLLTDAAPFDEVDSWLGSMEDQVDTFKPFLLCATTRGDMASVWSNYGKGADGYAVQFDPSVEFRVVGDGSETYQPDSLPIPVWREVHYGTPDIESGFYRPREEPTCQLIENALTTFAHVRSGRYIDDEVVMKRLEREYWSTVTTIKDESFSSESEIRVVAFSPPGTGFIRSRQTAFGEFPYVRLARDGGQDILRYDALEVASLPIVKVRLGPQTPGERRGEILSLLARNGYSGVEVEAVSPRFRSW